MRTIDPMHQFEVKRLINLNVFGFDISLTNSALVMGLVVGICGLLALFLRKNRAIVPSRGQGAVELFMGAISKLISDNLDEKSRKYFGFVFSLFIFILLSNLLGLIPYSFAPTSHISVTFVLGIIAFLICLVITIARHGVFFLKVFVPKGSPWWIAPLMFIIEFFSFLVRPVSLSVRLAANMIAGHVMLDVIAFFVIMLKVFGIFPLLFLNIMMCFEIFVAFLQAYIFSIFVCVYINEALHH